MALELKDEDRLNLDKLIANADNFQDNTEYLREKKQSKILITSIRVVQLLKVSHRDLLRDSPEEFIELCKTKCNYFYKNYTYLFHKLIQDDLDLSILNEILNVMKMIEEGVLNHAESGGYVGKRLGELFVDSAVKRANKLSAEADAQTEQHRPVTVNDSVIEERKNVGWAEFKKMNTTV